MPFRENEDASRARAEALAEEVAELRSERDALLADKAAREVGTVNPTSPAAAPEPPKPVMGTWTSLLFLACVVLAIALWISRDKAASAVDDARNVQRLAAWTARARDWDTQVQSWAAYIETEPCMRSVEMDALSLREAAKSAALSRKYDPQLASLLRAVRPSCTHDLRTLSAPSWAKMSWAPRVEDWIAAEDLVMEPAKQLAAYYGARDYQPDDFTHTLVMWATLQSAMDKRAAAIAHVREVGVPFHRKLIRDKQEQHKPQRDELWWRIELGLAIWDVDEKWMRASGISDGKTPDVNAGVAAIRDSVDGLLASAKRAPIGLRQELEPYQDVTTAILARLPVPVERITVMVRDMDLLAALREHVPDLGERPDSDEPPPQPPPKAKR